MKNQLKGGCHCGNVKVVLSTSIRPEEFHPRACDCSFCMMHGASYVSDPAGGLAIDVTGPDTLGEYRQGSGSAAILLCRRCGVVVAAVYQDGASRYGTVNSRCLDERAALGVPETVSPQTLGVGEKKSRWVRLWTPGVEINTAK